MSESNLYVDPTLPVRELLRLSQTDVTPDPNLGLRYAEVAYDMAQTKENMANDPTAKGEAAAKAMFRNAQLNKPDEFEIWFKNSIDSLVVPDARMRRERIATFLLAGRGRGLMYLRAPETLSALEAAAAHSFLLADEVVAWTRKESPGDPYRTMLDAHWATFEAVRPHGDALFASKIALNGIAAAITSRKEQANSASESMIKHAKFVTKHVLLNTVALGLAVSRPFNSIEPVAQQRHDLALKILG